MAFKKGEGGRPKGARNLKTRVRELEAEKRAQRVDRTAKVAAADEVALAEGGAPVSAREGITPRDLLLESMRASWEAAHLKGAKLRELSERIEAADGAVAMAKMLSEQAVGRADAKEKLAELARVVELAADLKGKHDALRAEISGHLTAARDLAKDVAPYEHPKLTSQDHKIAANVTVVLQDF